MIKKQIIVAMTLMLSFSVLACGGNDKSGSNAQQNQEQKTQSEYKTAPDFSIQSISGEQITLSDFRGKVVILDFWDTWCPPCRKGIPDFIEIYSSVKDSGFVMIGIAFGREGVQKVKTFAQEYNINYPVIVATEQLMNDYGPIRSIPTAFIIDKKGRIIKRYVGLRPKTEFEHDIQYLLNEKE